MSSYLYVNLSQFPVIPSGTELGEEFTFVVTGRLNKLEQEEVDVTGLGSRPSYVAGYTEARLSLLAIEPLYSPTFSRPEAAAQSS